MFIGRKLCNIKRLKHIIFLNYWLSDYVNTQRQFFIHLADWSLSSDLRFPPISFPMKTGDMTIMKLTAN